jgi:hypothetical protein
MPRRLIETLLPVLAAVLLLPAGLQAEAALRGEARFAAARAEPVWVGEEVELHLELWTDGLSFGDQLFVLPEVPGGFLLQGDSSTVKLSENRSGQVWQGLRYTLLLYPQIAGRLEVPAFDVRFTARAGFGSQPEAFSFRTEALAVESRLPEGAAAGELLVTTSEFTMDAGWDRRIPDEGALQLLAGDALTLEVRRRAADVPGMVFAPLVAPAIEGLGVYPESPRVEDSVNRGVLTGTRTDRMTFVCEAPGRYEIPGWRFRWWDPERQRLSEKVIPALQLEVAANPSFGPAAGPAQAADDGNPWGNAFLALLVVLILGAAWRRFGGLLLRRLRGRNGRKPTSGPEPRTGRLLPLNPRRPGPRPD